MVYTGDDGLRRGSEMTLAGHSSLGDFQRSQLVKTVARAVATAVVLVVLYYEVPIEQRPHQSIALRLIVALAVFSVVLAVEVRQIAQHDHPMLRAGVAMATVIPLFLVVFAWIYLTMSTSSFAAFGGHLTRTTALYFTVTVFSTVGFGDITPKTDPARLVVTVQMLADLAVLAIVVRLILGAATRGMARLRASGEE
jgi:ACR3 family arsenite efflux pump ArsB